MIIIYSGRKGRILSPIIHIYPSPKGGGDDLIWLKNICIHAGRWKGWKEINFLRLKISFKNEKAYVLF